MPKFRQTFLQSIFYLYRSLPNEKVEGPMGTGVVVSMEPGLLFRARHVYAITSQHVVKQGAATIRMLDLLFGAFLSLVESFDNGGPWPRTR